MCVCVRVHMCILVCVGATPGDAHGQFLIIPGFVLREMCLMLQFKPEVCVLFLQPLNFLQFSFAHLGEEFLWPYLKVLRSDCFWSSGTQLRCQGLNLGWPHARPTNTLTPLLFHQTPRTIFKQESVLRRMEDTYTPLS